MAGRSKRRLHLALAVLVTVIVGVAPMVALADFTEREWQFEKAVVLPPGIEQAVLVEMAPDPEVYANAAARLADLRVVEGSVEVPYKLLVERGERRRSAMSVTIRDLGRVPGESISFVADLGREGILHNEIEVLTPSLNFQRNVVVEGSRDGVAWAVLESDGQIFDFTIRERGFSERYTRVRYPDSTARYLRVLIADDEETGLEVAGAVAYHAQVLSPRETELPATIVSRAEAEEDRTTSLVLDLGTPGFPTSGITVSTPQENFYRLVAVEGSADAVSWRRVQTSEVLYSFDTPKFVGGKLSVAYPESTFRYYRLIVRNEDNPPLPITGASAHGYLRKLIFEASPGGNYRLYYGNSDAIAPSYELERVFPYLVTENLPRAALGSHASNPAFLGLPAPPVTERLPWLLPTAVAIASLVIGLFLASLFRQVRRNLPPPSA